MCVWGITLTLSFALLCFVLFAARVCIDLVANANASTMYSVQLLAWERVKGGKGLIGTMYTILYTTA